MTLYASGGAAADGPSSPTSAWLDSHADDCAQPEVESATRFSKWRAAPRAFYSGYGLESIREVQVLTSRFSAQNGEALASVTNVVTRAGTDQWQRSVLLFVQDDVVNSTPPFAPTKPPQSTQQFGVSAGGPLVRNRTRFFGNYEGRRSRGHNVVVSPAAPSAFGPNNEDEHVLFARVDQRLGIGRALMTRTTVSGSNERAPNVPLKSPAGATPTRSRDRRGEPQARQTVNANAWTPPTRRLAVERPGEGSYRALRTERGVSTLSTCSTTTGSGSRIQCPELRCGFLERRSHRRHSVCARSTSPASPRGGFESRALTGYRSAGCRIKPSNPQRSSG